MEIFLTIVQLLLQLVFILMFVSMIMSWIDIEQRFAFTRIVRGLIEPIISPIRAVIPPAGFLDLSFFVAIILLQVMSAFVGAVK